MHNCTCASGNTLSIVSGNPLSHRHRRLKTSATPRFFSSVSTWSQNFDPSAWLAHNPNTSLLPCIFHANSHIHRPVAHMPRLPNLYHQRLQVNDRIHRVQRSALPSVDLLHHRKLPTNPGVNRAPLTSSPA